MKATKILLVDDDATMRSIPALFLRKWGYDVIEAGDGLQALEILEREPIGLVISDWVMPHVTGIELCRRIRARDTGRYTYLILCTSKGEKSDLLEGLEAGADDFLIKPIGKEEMRARVHAGERVLELERGLAQRNLELSGINEQLQTAYERIEGDLKSAAWMQSNLLPSPSRKTLNIASQWRFRPSSYVAGDIFNIFAVDEHRVGFYLLDVSGHGVPAAMLSVTLSMFLNPDSSHENPLTRHNALTGAREVVPPAEVVSELNRRFQSKDDRYFTIIYGLLDSRTGELALTQAGHPNPIVIHRDGSRELEVLGEGGAPVGLWPDMEYDTIYSRLCPGDRLVLYSDGVVECADPQGTLFGEERFVNYLREAGAQPLSQLLDGLESAMEAWRGGRDFEDDVSLLALELIAPRPESTTPEFAEPELIAALEGRA
jgi:sigma-B regulation protein RsbU (phosphoserine phosphatase)